VFGNTLQLIHLPADIPGLLVSVMDEQPWVRKDKKNGNAIWSPACNCTISLLGKLLKYIEGKWREIPPADKLQLTKTDAQV